MRNISMCRTRIYYFYHVMLTGVWRTRSYDDVFLWRRFAEETVCWRQCGNSIIVELETVAGKFHPAVHSTLGQARCLDPLYRSIRHSAYLLRGLLIAAVPVVDGQELDQVLLLTVADYHQHPWDDDDHDIHLSSRSGKLFFKPRSLKVFKN